LRIQANAAGLELLGFLGKSLLELRILGFLLSAQSFPGLELLTGLELLLLKPFLQPPVLIN